MYKNFINLFQVNSHYLLNKKKYLEKIDEVLSSGKYILGSNVKKFENDLKNFTKSQYVISTSNGTDALEICIRALSLSSNDEVIVPSFSWISSASSIKLAGAKPIFCDIELDTYGLDYQSLNKKINHKTKAVIIVSLYGQIPRDIFKIKKLCKKKNIILIEDAAQSFGSRINKFNSCNIADLSTTSFFPTKSFGGYGDAGAIFTNKKKLSDKIKKIRQNGTLDKKKFKCLGKNARMDEIQAALLSLRLKDFKKILAIKKKNAKFFIEHLKKFFFIYDAKNNNPSYSLFTLRHPKRDKIINFLRLRGIDSGIYYKQKLHHLKFLNKSNEDFKNTKKATEEVFSIPIHESLKKHEKYKIVKNLIKFFN